MTMTRLAKILIANRGEIAVRIARTCRELGIGTVAVYSDADADAPHVTACDEAVHLPGVAPGETYLRRDLILEAAARTGADAVHPGYGFLSENADFATAVADAGLTFIGPPPSAIASMGSKIEAKRIMHDAGVPILEGVEAGGLDDDELLAAAEQVGYPILVKASAGGGGKGMRIVAAADELIDAVAAARREAAGAFGDDTVFLERYLERARHVEIQVVGDTHGNVVDLFERECSIQRRHQKIIEEAPSPAVDTDLREAMGKAAVDAARAVGYEGAGTVEFMLAGREFFFLEMNTRLQVEHPVTELITGLDLVRVQILIAEGRELPRDVCDPAMRGHAIEARLYAEDPANDFLPVTGTLHRFRFPDHLRLDTGVTDGSEISVHYDPMLAKVIAFAPTREEAALALAQGLEDAEIYGPRTNRELLVRVLRSAPFLAGDTDTGFLDRMDVAALSAPLGENPAVHALAATLADQAQRRSAARVHSTIPSGWRNAPSQLQIQEWDTSAGELAVGYRFDRDGLVAELNGEPVRVVLHDATANTVDLTVDGVRRRFSVFSQGDQVWVSSPLGHSHVTRISRFPEPMVEEAPGSLLSPMPGKVVTINAEVGGRVSAGDTIVVIEAMKMEHAVRSPINGTVGAVPVSVGQQVNADQVLAVVEAEDAASGGGT
jgi:acetyl/propionyl-CoA carboxylase alpha subunit